MAAAAYRSSSTVANDTGTTFTVTKPTGCVDGDLLTAFQATTLGGGTNPATPSGWTACGISVGFGVGKVFQKFEKPAASEGASWTFNGPGGSPVGNECSVYCICTTPGATASEANGSVGGGTGTTATPAAYTTLVDNELILVAWSMVPGVSADITPHASFTALAQIGSASGLRLRAGYKNQAVAGAVADRDATLSESASWGGFLAAIPPSPLPPAPISRIVRQAANRASTY